MNRIMLAILMLLAPNVGLAGDWRQLSGPEIQSTLTDQTVEYEAATQEFYASGKTLYDSGQPSWGSWRVEGDEYCSQWPPSGLWACYGVDVIDGTERLRFTSSDGGNTEGIFVP